LFGQRGHPEQHRHNQQHRQNAGDNPARPGWIPATLASDRRCGKWIFFDHFTSGEFNQSAQRRPSEEFLRWSTPHRTGGFSRKKSTAPEKGG